MPPSSVYPSLCQHPHQGCSWCCTPGVSPRGSGFQPPAPHSCPCSSRSASAPLSTWGLQARTSSSVLPAHMAHTQPLTQALPSCTPAGGDPARRPSLDHKKRTEWIRGLGFYVMAAQPRSSRLIQGPTLARTGPGEMVPCAGWVQHLSWAP